MVRERYIPRDNQWQSFPNANWRAFVDAVETQVGATVPMDIQPGGKIVLDTDDLPDGVSERDAKQAIRDNHPHR